LVGDQEVRKTINCYFKREELLETVSKTSKFDSKEPIKKKVNNYDSTGAVYLGEMQGGFRHGNGKMVW